MDQYFDSVVANGNFDHYLRASKVRKNNVVPFKYSLTNMCAS